MIDNAYTAPRFPSILLVYGSIANPADKLIGGLLELSELFPFQEKWHRLSKSDPKEPNETLSFISATFEDLGYQLADEATNLANGKRTRNFGDRYNKVVRKAIQSTGNPEIRLHLSTAEIAYQSAIVCDLFALNCYVSLAGLYLFGDSQQTRDFARDVCRLFDQADDRLHKKADSDLSSVQRVYRDNHDSLLTKVRQDIDGIKRIVGLEISPWQEVPEKQSDDSTRQHLYEISKGLVGDRPRSQEKKETLCKNCKKLVTPTFHGCCPECGEFL